jgi:hypothetical protein
MPGSEPECPEGNRIHRSSTAVKSISESGWPRGKSWPKGVRDCTKSVIGLTPSMTSQRKPAKRSTSYADRCGIRSQCVRPIRTLPPQGQYLVAKFHEVLGFLGELHDTHPERC